MRLSAASKRSLATADTLALFGNAGSAGRDRPNEFDSWLWAGVPCSDAGGGSLAEPDWGVNSTVVGVREALSRYFLDRDNCRLQPATLNTASAAQ